MLKIKGGGALRVKRGSRELNPFRLPAGEPIRQEKRPFDTLRSA